MLVPLPTFAELTEHSFFMVVTLQGMNIPSSIEELVEVALLVDEEEEAS
jgi:hypothetical protein